MKRAALSVLTVILPVTALSGGIAHADVAVNAPAAHMSVAGVTADVDPNTVAATVESAMATVGVPIDIPALPTVDLPVRGDE